ncbi:MAG: hydroxymethylbilane synthase [Bacteriovoracia bacterium]
MTKKLKLGTRRSLLAMAQSAWVAREIERANPATSVELVGIETQGDRIVDVPLRQVEGKEFFVAELDQALTRGEVDFTVHSMKDLSLERPTAIRLGAIPQRENSRDIVLFRPEVMEKLRAGETLQIGTSSPRRLENIPPFLRQALPRFSTGGSTGTPPLLAFEEIRGNVNTRLRRVREPSSSPRALDGVVLALAGLARLWADEAGRRELSELLRGLRWMVLPLKENPTAPAQGALAIECRADDDATWAMLRKIHHVPTEQEVSRERAVLAQYGGGCHQRFGASAVAHARLGNILYIQGKKSNGEPCDEVRWPAPPAREAGGVSWDGTQARAKSMGENRLTDLRHWDTGWKAGAVFVAHSRAMPQPWPVTWPHPEELFFFTSGTPSWFRLAELGYWVNGSAEQMGFDFLRPLLEQPVLSMPAASHWVVLTHDDAADSWGTAWPGSHVIPTYHVDTTHANDAAIASLGQAKHVFWGSGSQFRALRSKCAKNAVHACGPGQTAETLADASVPALVFPSVEEWRKWVSSHE